MKKNQFYQVKSDNEVVSFLLLNLLYYTLVHWLDFGAFSSFAPASDSNHANATYENTYMGRSAKRLRKSKQNDVPKAEDMETEDAELNAAWLAKEGLDMDVIEAATNRALDNVNEELERNSELLEELLSYQKTRFSGDQSKWTAVEEKEVEIGKSITIVLKGRKQII